MARPDDSSQRRAMLPASQRCPAHQAFASAFKGGNESAKDAAMELYSLLEAAEKALHVAELDAPMTCPTSKQEQLSSLGELLPSPLPGPEEIALGVTQLDSLKSALENLPPVQREVIRLRFFEEATLVQAGRSIGRSRQAVHLREKLALDHLRDILEHSHA